VPTRLQSYNGRLSVEDDEFELSAERFIPREDGVSFRLTGFDNLGGFVAEGFAKKSGDLYVAGSTPLKYAHYAHGDDRAVIDFTAVREMYRRSECHVLGVWVQNGITWSFKGTLRPFDPKRGALLEAASQRLTPVHVATTREIKAIKRKLASDSMTEGEKAKRDRALLQYAKKSERKMRKSSTSKAKRRDLYTKGKRTPGSAFSRRGR